MAARYDVAGRLAEGQTAVDDVQTYVGAAQARGYVNADLTVHSGQVREWYGTEDGLNLRLLDADCAALRTVAQTAEDALRAVRDQAAALEQAWTGSGGSAAAEFLRRHTAAGTEVADVVRRAAEAYAMLRDQLWDVVDRKVSSTAAIDDRTRSQRPGWLTAAHAVLAGAQDDTSVEVIDTEVKPFVDNDIRGEWLPAMRSATDAATAAYRVATDAVDSRAGVRFDVPGDLGPRYVPPPAGAAVPVVAPTAVRPASATAVDDSWPVDAAPAPLESAAVAAPPPLPPAAPVPSAPPAPPELPTSAPGLGALPGLSGGSGSGGGLPDLGGLLGDLFGGPTDTPAFDPLPDSLPDNAIDEPTLDDPDEDTDETEEVEEVDDPEDEEPDPADATAGEPTDDCPTGSEEEPSAPAAVAAPDAPEAPVVPAVPATPAAPLATPAAPLSGETPCEIAADELPQAGE